ncbi:hypothetical protein FACS1894145_4980 [Bacteroidia bacterium]|nr:hypothetical protein FACS1894145_4980 [Bacteroidia bacterium]
MAKYTYITLIFMANLLLLAHTVIPHHHHHGAPHFVLFETHAHDNAGNDCCCTHEDENTCVFEQDINAVYKQSEENGSGVSCVLHRPELFLQTAVYAVFIADFSLVRETDAFFESPYLISYYCDYAGAGWGLRAPPVFTLNFLKKA